MTDLFEATKPTAPALSEIKRFCDACGQEINLQRESWAMTSTGVKHVTCPASAAIRALPTIPAAETEDRLEKAGTMGQRIAALNREMIAEMREPAVPGAPVYLTMDEAGKLLRVSKDTIRNRIKAGALPAQRLRGGQTVLIDQADVLALLEPVPVGEG